MSCGLATGGTRNDERKLGWRYVLIPMRYSSLLPLLETNGVVVPAMDKGQLRHFVCYAPMRAEAVNC